MPGIAITDADLEALRAAPYIAKEDNPLHRLDAGKAATYKVEINLKPRGGKSLQVIGRIAIMRSGGDMNGDMDEACFICPRCKKLLLPEHVQADFFSCPHCVFSADSEQVSEAAVFVLTNQNLAQLILRYWLTTGADADIYLKRYKHSMGSAVEALKQKDWRGYSRRYRQAKEQKEVVIYPLKNIMKDNLSGADMTKRFLAFLKA